MARRQLGLSTLQILAAVGQDYRYGFDIMDFTGLQSGTVYRGLSRLEELDLVGSKWEDADLAVEAKRPRRRYYTITRAGAKELAAARERFKVFGNLPSPQPAS